MSDKSNHSQENWSTADELKKVGERMKAIRMAKGYPSHEKFAFEHDLNRSQYWRYEKGIDLKFSTFVKVLKALGVSYEEFFSEGFE